VRVDKNYSMAPLPRNTVRDALSVAVTVGAYGVAFGAASVAAGFSVLQTCLFSLFTFTGASQFAAIGVVAAGGCRQRDRHRHHVGHSQRALRNSDGADLGGARTAQNRCAHVTIDESTGVALSQKPRGVNAMREGFWVTGLGVFVFWNVFTLLGALGAKALGNPASWGLDGAVPAVFLGLRLAAPREHVPAGRGGDVDGLSRCWSRRGYRPACRSSRRRWLPS
jgi:predicted branched-subunit amino acid permease